MLINTTNSTIAQTTNPWLARHTNPHMPNPVYPKMIKTTRTYPNQSLNFLFILFALPKEEITAINFVE